VLEPPRRPADQEIQQVTRAILPKKRGGLVFPEREEDAKMLESKGFGKRSDDGKFELKDYEVLYLMYTGKLNLFKGGEKVDFDDFVSFCEGRDENAWTRFLIFRDLRSRGYVVREGFGFPIDFRVYERGDYGDKAAKYVVFGLIEGKTMTVSELRKYVEEMSVMGKEAVICVVERRGEVIYYKVGKWRPTKPD
jgi:tRNA-intron endonuclease